MAQIVPINVKSAKKDNFSYYLSYKLYQNQKKKRYQALCYPISHVTKSICKTLFCIIIFLYFMEIVNNNEINVIIGSYLSMWIKNPEEKYVLKSTLMSYFDEDCESYINHFFIDEKVNCNDYVLFICLFLFYTSSEILSVLIAMCGITSNIIITKDKMDLFCEYFHIDKNYYETVLHILDNLENSYSDSELKAYDLKAFYKYMSDSFYLISSIQKLKQNMMKLTFDVNSFERIMNKKNYYYFKNANYIFIPIEKENCLERIYRLLFTNKPSPFYYDYSTKNTLDRERACVLYRIRRKFGYSKRNSSTFFNSFSSKSLKLQLNPTYSKSSYSMFQNSNVSKSPSTHSTISHNRIIPVSV